MDVARVKIPCWIVLREKIFADPWCIQTVELLHPELLHRRLEDLLDMGIDLELENLLPVRPLASIASVSVDFITFLPRVQATHA